MIISFFEKIDLLGSKFHFYDGVSLKRRTVIGGILTIILGIISIIFFLIFGKDLFMRTNPNITISIQNDSIYEYIDLKQENIIFAFRIEDHNGHYINETNILYIKIYYYSSEPDNEGKYRSYSHGEYINYHICTDDDLKIENLTKYYGTLFCAEFGGKKFGGNWYNPYMHLFEFQIFYCKNGSKYSINNTCTSFNTLNSFFNKDNPSIFSLYYPVIEFDPLSYYNPLKISYKNYYHDLSYKTQKTDHFILKKTILNDDKGLLFNKFQNISLWGIEQIISSYKFYTEDDLKIEGSSSKIYSLVIYNTSENNYYIRSYSKLHHVIAIIGSLINLILNICNKISHTFGESIRKLEILNSFFDFDEKNDNELLKKNYSSQMSPIKNLTSENNEQIKNNKKFYLENNNSKTLFPIFFPNKNNIVKVNVKKSEKKVQINANKFFSKPNYSYDNSNSHIFQRRKTLPLMSTKINVYEKNYFYKSNLTLKQIIFENLKIYIFFCCSNRKVYDEYFNIKHSNLIQYYYINLIQLNRYLKIVHEYHYLKRAFMNEFQIKSLLFLKRINLTNKKERNEISENASNNINVEENVITYFKSLNNISNFDKFILANLSENIKNKII